LLLNLLTWFKKWRSSTNSLIRLETALSFPLLSTGWSNMKSFKEQGRSEYNYIQNSGKCSCLKYSIFVISTFLELKLLYKQISPKDPPHFSLFYIGLFKVPSRPKAYRQQLVTTSSFIMSETFTITYISSHTPPPPEDVDSI
jgi:hypothetical protein